MMGKEACTKHSCQAKSVDLKHPHTYLSWPARFPSFLPMICMSQRQLLTF
eukprot:jgi/Mesvir1/12424/Mv26516-RA.1